MTYSIFNVGDRVVILDNGSGLSPDYIGKHGVIDGISPDKGYQYSVYIEDDDWTVPLSEDEIELVANKGDPIRDAWNILEEETSQMGIVADWKDTEPKCYSTAPKSALDVQVGGSHYKDLPIQPVEFILANGLGFCEGSIIKYTCRYKQKGGVEDLRKVIHYAELLIEQLEREKK